MPDFRPSLTIGIAATLFAVAAGTGWQLLNRAGAIGGLGPLDLALFRYCIPALLLLPLLMREGLFPPGKSRVQMLVMVIGGGLPFGLLMMAGAQFAPAAHMGAIAPGATPVMVALLAALVLGERISRMRIVGFAIIIAGVALIMRQAFEATWPGAWRGDLLFLAAALLWAFYTIAVRQLGLSPWHMVAISSFWSGIAAAALWLAFGNHSLFALPLPTLALQIIWQGVIAGFLAMVAFGIAVKHLGATNTALSAALLPASVALGGFVLLGEAIEPIAMIGIALISVGIVAASGFLDKKRAA